MQWLPPQALATASAAGSATSSATALRSSPVKALGSGWARRNLSRGGSRPRLPRPVAGTPELRFRSRPPRHSPAGSARGCRLDRRDDLALGRCPCRRPEEVHRQLELGGVLSTAAASGSGSGSTLRRIPAQLCHERSGCAPLRSARAMAWDTMSAYRKRLERSPCAELRRNTDRHHLRSEPGVRPRRSRRHWPV